MKKLSEKLGVARRIEGRGLVIFQGDPLYMSHALALAKMLGEIYPRLSLVIVGDKAGGAPTQADWPSHATITPAPIARKFAAKNLLRRIRPLLILCPDRSGRSENRILALSYRRGCTILRISAPSSRELSGSAAKIETSLPGCISFEMDALADGFSVAWNAALPLEHFERSPGRMTATERSAFLEKLKKNVIPNKKKLSIERGKVSRNSRIINFLERNGFRSFLKLKYEKIEDLVSLKEMLGGPKVVLCLGNGPTSEDERLRHIKYDCVFRVNHSWKQRDFIRENVDLVFTTMLQTILEVRPRVGFITKTLQDEAMILSKNLFSLRKIRYGVAESLGIYDRQAFDPYSPTNGAIMIATAVLLNPEKLIIAGIDLFSHPSGAYPGDSKTSNDYDPGHERALEFAFITKALKGYRGELEILSPALVDLLDGRHGP